MKRIVIILVVGCMLLVGCGGNKDTVVKSKEVIPTELPEELGSQIQSEISNQIHSGLLSQLKSGLSEGIDIKKDQDNPYTNYIENPDGTYSTDRYTYQYKIRVTGRTANAVKDTTFEVLTNKKSVTFHEVAWSLLSSQSSDWLDEKETVIIGMY